MIEPTVFMPDGTPFPFWDDATDYRTIYHVASHDPAASDNNPGTEDRPFQTIGRAAALLQPGEKVVVHGGEYRECVRPARGGDGPDRMIAYEAAPGETVVVKGSREWAVEFRPSEGYRSGRRPDGANVWMGDLPAEWFIGYNPFMTSNVSSEFTSYGLNWSVEEVLRFLLRRGMVLADGRPLRQVFRYAELAEAAGTFWVEDPGLRLHFRLPNDADPKTATLEVTTQEQVFVPRQRGLGYIRISGLQFEHAADGIPIPQRAMVSAWRGHHWIIEDCRIRWANSTGLDLGNETWHGSGKAPGEPAGGHIVRRNVVSDCGACGIAACHNIADSLVEDNLVERIGGKDLQRIWETAGIKFHSCDHVLIRRNVFRHIQHASGLWLDHLNRNTRVTGNVFADIESLNGACYLEVNHAPMLADHNIFWDVRRPIKPGDKERFAPAVNSDTSELCTVAHNFFGKVRDGHAVSINLQQKGRLVDGRVGLCRRNKVLGNVFAHCPKWIQWGVATENASDGNLFGSGESPEFQVDYPEPRATLNLAGWREYYGQDRASTQAAIEADFDVERLVLTLSIAGDLPVCPPVPELHDRRAARSAGPFDLKPGRQTYTCRAGVSAPGET